MFNEDVRPVNFANYYRRPKTQDDILIDGIVTGLKQAGLSGEDITMQLVYTLQSMGRNDLLCPCCQVENKKNGTERTDCYFYYEDIDMGARISNCSKDRNLPYGCCPCEKCNVHFTNSDADKLVRAYLFREGGRNEEEESASS